MDWFLLPRLGWQPDPLTSSTDLALKKCGDRLPIAAPLCYARHMTLSDRQVINSLSRMPLVDSAELAGVLGEAHATVHRSLTGLLADGIVCRVSHGTAHLPSSHRYYLTTNGIRQAAGGLGFATPSDVKGGVILGHGAEQKCTTGVSVFSDSVFPNPQSTDVERPWGWNKG